MRKTQVITLGILAAAALAIGCDDHKDVKACVDKSGKMVADWNCQQQPQTANGQNPSDDNLVRNLLIYRWVYGGNYSNGYVSGYVYQPAPSIIYVSPHSSEGSSIVSSGSARAYSSSVSRGGFGSSFSGGEAAGE
jgi:hypothetical protein